MLDGGRRARRWVGDRLSEEEEVSDVDVKRRLVMVKAAWVLKNRDALLIRVEELDTFLKRFRVGQFVKDGVPEILMELAVDEDDALRGYAVSCLNSLTVQVPEFLKMFEIEQIVLAVKVNLEAKAASGKGFIFCWLASIMMAYEELIPVVCDSVGLDEVFDAGVEYVVENKCVYVASFFYRLLSVVEIGPEVAEKASLIFYYFLRSFPIPTDVLRGVHCLLSNCDIPVETRAEMADTLALHQAIGGLVERTRDVDYRKATRDWSKQSVLASAIVVDLIDIDVPAGLQMLPVVFDMVLFANGNLDRTKQGDTHRVQMISSWRRLITVDNSKLVHEICVWNESRIVRELLDMATEGAYDVKCAATKCLLCLMASVCMEDLLSMMRSEVIGCLTDAAASESSWIEAYSICIRRFIDCSHQFGQESSLCSILADIEAVDKLENTDDSAQVEALLTDMRSFLQGTIDWFTGTS